jgi:hypothetical protein
MISCHLQAWFCTLPIRAMHSAIREIVARRVRDSRSAPGICGATLLKRVAKGNRILQIGFGLASGADFSEFPKMSRPENIVSTARAN